MIIRLTKAADAKPGTLTCLREDGSRTWQPSTDYFVRHDLIHYAVETTLGYQEAFYGLLAKGKDLDDFGTRNGVKDTYTLEEHWAEGIVGVLQWPVIGGGLPPGVKEWLDLIEQAFLAQNLAPPPVTQDQLVCIQAVINDLHARWDQLPPGETLELSF